MLIIHNYTFLSSLIIPATCLSAIHQWMSNNFLKLNEDKTEILLIAPKAKRNAFLEPFKLFYLLLTFILLKFFILLLI